MILPLNVAFPAFFIPYISQLMAPTVGIAALAAELVVYRRLLPRLNWKSVIWLVILTNILSTLVGVGLALIVPPGFWYDTGAEPPQLRFNEEYGFLVGVGYLVAFALSVLIEAGVMATVLRRLEIHRPLRAAALANLASYAAMPLGFLLWVGVPRLTDLF